MTDRIELPPVSPAPPPAVHAAALRKQALFWAAAFVVAIGFVWALGHVLLPFLAGMALAYLLDPLVRQVQRLGLGRTPATLIVITFGILIFVVALLVVVPALITQVSALVDRLPGYFSRIQTLAMEQGKPWLNRVLGDSGDASSTATTHSNQLIAQGMSWLGTALKSLWSGGQSIVSLFSLVIVTPVVAIYLLLDWERMISAIDHWIPARNRETVRRLAREIDAAITGFVRGQALVCAILGTFYAIALSLIGLHFGALIGMSAGLATFVPFIGSTTGLVLALAVAVAQFWPDWIPVVAVIGVFAVGQFAEGNILQPKVVGDRIGVHPVWLMFALFAFGYLFGFVGLLLSVPMAAATAVLARFALSRYLASEIYRGPSHGPKAP